MSRLLNTKLHAADARSLAERSLALDIESVLKQIHIAASAGKFALSIDLEKYPYDQRDAIAKNLQEGLEKLNYKVERRAGADMRGGSWNWFNIRW